MALFPLSPSRRSLLRVVGLALPAFLLAAEGCSRDTGAERSAPSSAGGGGGTGGAGGAADLDAGSPSNSCTHDRPGCPCALEGQHLLCGEVVDKINGQTMCGAGVSACTGGKWSACVLSGAAPIPADSAPPGYYKTQGLGQASPCQNNPCDPYCVHYPDTPDTSVLDGGTNLKTGDGGLDTNPDAAPIPCTPATCAQLGKNCGPMSDGCGGTLNCGVCAAPLTCGGSGVPSVCGTFPTQPCTPQSCAAQGKNCGPISDGCGGVLQCGTCPFGQTCGGAGTPSVCAVPTPPGGPCVAKTCAQLGKNCGPASDTCGGLLACGSCQSPQFCGGGVPGVCGGSLCVPKTCAQLGKTCGPVADGCGGLLDCGSCQSPQICGGGGVPSVCGSNGLCTGLCLKQTYCASGGTTSITGTVYAPNGVDPIPNVVVYVPNAAVPAFPSGITCDNCASVLGSPLVSTKTAVDGTFTINNMPVGANIPLVIQIGRWRRQITIPTVTACQNTPISAALTRFPKNKGEGDIPQMALSTGCVDAMECVLRKMGIDDSEFTNPDGNGRIHLYAGGYCPGTYLGSCSGGSCFNGHWGGSGATPWESTLVGSPGTLDNYDMVLFPCQSSYFYYNAQTTYENNIADYVNAGGRAFMTHYNWIWLYSGGVYSSPLSSAINWNLDQNAPPDQTGYIDTSFSRGLLLANWLQQPAIGASSALGQIALNTVRHDYNSVNAGTQNWLTVDSPSSGLPVHLTFDTPRNVSASNQCGRVVFSDFHVENSNNTQFVFPSECGNGAMTPQEKLLEFMLFDLASCVGSPPPPSTCTPTTCAAQGITCGQAGDGCGGTLSCGPACTQPSCTATTCAAQNLFCGLAGDGCGNQINCGTCVAPQTCGGSGVPGLCGSPPPCAPRGCSNPGVSCGQEGDGCGGTLNCGCTAPATCGGAGVPGKCGSPPACVKTTCAAQGVSCGQTGDGCGGTLSCGTCTAPQTCGGGGVPGQCGAVDFFTDGTFVRDYSIECPQGTTPYWQLWSWTAVTPADTFLDYTVQTADTQAGLDTAPSDPLLFSLPPGPLSLVDQPTRAHAAGMPAGTPDTQSGAASVDYTLQKASRKRNLPFLRVTTHLAPSADKRSGPTLSSWDMQVDCIPSE